MTFYSNSCWSTQNSTISQWSKCDSLVNCKEGRAHASSPVCQWLLWLLIVDCSHLFNFTRVESIFFRMIIVVYIVKLILNLLHIDLKSLDAYCRRASLLIRYSVIGWHGDTFLLLRPVQCEDISSEFDLLTLASALKVHHSRFHQHSLLQWWSRKPSSKPSWDHWVRKTSSRVDQQRLCHLKQWNLHPVHLCTLDSWAPAISLETSETAIVDSPVNMKRCNTGIQ